MDSFRSTFLRIFHLSISGPFGILFEHLQNTFDPKDSMTSFIQFHQLCSHAAVNHIFGFVVRILRVNQLLTLAKPSNGIHIIVVGEALYRLMNMVLCL